MGGTKFEESGDRPKLVQIPSIPQFLLFSPLPELVRYRSSAINESKYTYLSEEYRPCHLVFPSSALA